MTACPDFERLLLARAAETLTPEDAARLENHLATCAGCAEEAKALLETVALAKLPPVTARERISLQSLPLSTLAAWHRGERLRLFRRAGLGIAAAAAVALVIVVPTVVRKSQPAKAAVQVEDPTVAALESWGAEDPIADSLADSILGGTDVPDD